MAERVRAADLLYPSNPPKPARARTDSDGWRELPGGGWYKPGPGSPLQFVDPSHGQPERPADAFYGSDHK